MEHVNETSNEEVLREQDELEQLKQEYESQQEKVSKLESLLRAVNEKYVTLSKEHEQLKDHFRKEKELLKKYGHEALIKDMLDILDNFERAMNQLKSLNTEDKTINNILIGIDMIYKDLKNTLHKHGLEEIELKGQIFDPTVAEAVETIQDENCGSNEIVDVLVKGYKLHDKLIRAGKVIVNISEEEIT